MTNLPQYFIEDGVHRAVAARECGLVEVPAILYESGQPPRMILVDLDQLYSPKRSVSRTDPRHNYAGLEAAMRTTPGRSNIPRIAVQPLGARGQPSSVPLAQVQISN